MRSTSWHESVIVASARAAGIERIARSVSVTVRGTSPGKGGRAGSLLLTRTRWQHTYFWLFISDFQENFTMPVFLITFFLGTIACPFFFYSFLFQRLMIHHVNNKFKPPPCPSKRKALFRFTAFLPVWFVCPVTKHFYSPPPFLFKSVWIWNAYYIPLNDGYYLLSHQIRVCRGESLHHPFSS